jgi:EVE domain
MQVNHGKAGALKRMRPGDGVVYYAPTDERGSADRLQSFVSIGIIAPGDLYQGDMGGGFLPWRRDVDYWQAQPSPIQPLLPKLSMTSGKKNWGYAFRFGVAEMTGEDFATVARAMRAEPAGPAR